MWRLTHSVMRCSYLCDSTCGQTEAGISVRIAFFCIMNYCGLFIMFLSLNSTVHAIDACTSASMTEALFLFSKGRVDIHTKTYTHTYTYTHIHTQTHTHTHTRTHTHTHTHAHTHRHIYITARTFGRIGNLCHGSFSCRIYIHFKKIPKRGVSPQSP